MTLSAENACSVRISDVVHFFSSMLRKSALLILSAGGFPFAAVLPFAAEL